MILKQISKRSGLKIVSLNTIEMPSQYHETNNSYSKYKTNILAVKRQKQLNKLIQNGKQETLDSYYNQEFVNNIIDISILDIPELSGSKSIQSIFYRGELYMEQNPDLGTVDVTQYPERTTVKGVVKRFRTGTVKELWNVDSEQDLNGIELTDERIQLDIECEYDGNTFEITADYPFYQDPSSNTKFGRFIQRWGMPEVDQEVSVDFDDDGNGTVVGTTE